MPRKSSKSTPKNFDFARLLLRKSKSNWKKQLNTFQAEVLKELEERPLSEGGIPPTIYEKISDILELPPLEIDYPNYDNDAINDWAENACGEYSDDSGNEYEAPVHTFEDEVSTEEETIDSTCEPDMDVHPPTPRPRTPDVFEDIRSPYQKFFSAPEIEAARWRPQINRDDLDFNELTLDEQGDIIASRISRDFCKFLKASKLESENVNEATLKELFQVGIGRPASSTLCTDIREMAAVPSNVAAKYNAPEKSIQSGIRKQIKWDGLAENAEYKTSAFGRSIKSRWKPPALKTTDKWNTVQVVPKNMRTFKDIWGPVFNTNLIKDFIEWLKSNPDVPRPARLIELGYLPDNRSGPSIEQVLMDSERLEAGTSDRVEFRSPTPTRSPLATYIGLGEIGRIEEEFDMKYERIKKQYIDSD